MLLTIFHMIYTALKKRQKLLIKAQICEAFKKYSNKGSVLFYPSEDTSGLNQINVKYVLNSPLCEDGTLIKVKMAKKFDRHLVGIFVLYPKQEIDITSWLKVNYINGISCLPFDKHKGCQLSTKSDDHIYVLIETNFKSYYKDTLEHCIHVEDYGLIIAWSLPAFDIHLNLLIKTDVDHIADFAYLFVQGQHYINNCLFVERVQNVTIKGVPCKYRETGKKHELSRDILQSFSNATLTAAGQRKPCNVDNCPDIIVYSHLVMDEKVRKAFVEKEEIKKELRVKREIEKTLFHMNNQIETYNHYTKSLELAKNEIYTKNSMNPMPLHILIYTERICGGKYLAYLLNNILNPKKYKISILSEIDTPKYKFLYNTALVIVYGIVRNNVIDWAIDYVTRGGNLLILRSNMMHIFMPLFTIASKNLSINGLINFSYGKWEHVRVMHDSYYYQSYPKQTQFAEDDIENGRTPTFDPPETVFIDSRGKTHEFDVEILSREETWQNPCILVATLKNNGAKMLFSQVHLETDPKTYEDKLDIFEVLQESYVACTEILADLLSMHLNLEIKSSFHVPSEYTFGFLIDDNGSSEKYNINYKIMVPNFTLHYIPSDLKPEERPIPTENYLPAITNAKFYKVNFSIESYYKFLRTRLLGRYLLYSDVMASTMNFSAIDVIHGFVVVTRRQTRGRGRHSNEWISPVGSVMFYLRLEIRQNSILGSRIPLLQHVITLAMVLAVKCEPKYKCIPLNIKWPNDIYIGDTDKIGCITVQKKLAGPTYFCDISVGINLSNSEPTTCINDAILIYNKRKATYKIHLETFTYEQYLALVFSQLEILLDIVENKDIKDFYDIYYSVWLHSGEEVIITDLDGFLQKGNIIDIDENGFLRVAVEVEGEKHVLIVHPDANSFNYLEKLISPI